MDEFERVYGSLSVWKTAFLPSSKGGQDRKLMSVSLKEFVERYARFKKCPQYQKQILERLLSDNAAVGVTLTDIQLDEAAWER